MLSFVKICSLKVSLCKQSFLFNSLKHCFESNSFFSVGGHGGAPRVLCSDDVDRDFQVQHSRGQGYSGLPHPQLSVQSQSDDLHALWCP